MAETDRTVNVGLIGLGTVGGGVAKVMARHRDEYRAAYGIDVRIKRACALEEERARELGVEGDAFTQNWQDIVSDPDIDIVVELIGGEHPATEIFEGALGSGKHVVSANKALLGRHVERLAGIAAEHGVQIRCEASAGGGIPIVNALEHALVGNEVLTVAGILNGTTNYILSRMDAEGLDFAEVLADADEGRCSVVFLTHTASERDVAAARTELESLEVVERDASVTRIEDVEAWSEGAEANE